MTLSLYDISVPTYLQILTAMSGFLEKARKHFAEKGPALSEVLEARLIDDMWPLQAQVISTVHHSRGAIAGVLSGRFAPPDLSGTYDYAALQALVAEGRDTLQAMTPEEVNARANAPLEFHLAGRVLPFTTQNFITSFSMPNFYFHATTTYDLLRAKGAPLGKRDFIGALRMGT